MAQYESSLTVGRFGLVSKKNKAFYEETMTIADTAAFIVSTEATTYPIGSRIYYNDPLSGGVEGQVKTTTGWKAFGVIA